MTGMTLSAVPEILRNAKRTCDYRCFTLGFLHMEILFHVNIAQVLKMEINHTYV